VEVREEEPLRFLTSSSILARAESIYIWLDFLTSNELGTGCGGISVYSRSEFGLAFFLPLALTGVRGICNFFPRGEHGGT